MASLGVSAVLEGCTEVDTKGKDISIHTTARVELDILDNHQQKLSFSDVSSADVTIRNLGVEADVATSFADGLKAKFAKPKGDNVENGMVGKVRKKLLRHISADFPAGTLSAIMGGSGSGKVRFRLLPSPQVGTHI